MLRIGARSAIERLIDQPDRALLLQFYTENETALPLKGGNKLQSIPPNSPY